MIVKNIPLLRRLFEILQIIAQNKTLSTKLRVKAIGILSESAYYEYKNCDDIINIIYSELIDIINNENEVLALRVEAIMLIFLFFQYYQSRLPKDKAIMKKQVLERCFENLKYFLKNKDNDTEGWLASIDFLIQHENAPLDLTCDKIFKEYNQKLIHIAYNKNEEIGNRLFSINLLFESIYKDSLKIHPINALKLCFKKSCCDPQFRGVVVECFEILYQIANDETVNASNRVEAIRLILAFCCFEKDILEKMFDPCSEKLVELLHHGLDAQALLPLCILLFSQHKKNKASEKMVKDCVEQIYKIANDQKENYAIRVKAIEFIVYQLKNKSLNFVNKESQVQACDSLTDILLSGNFLAEGYLDSVRMYLNMMYRHKKPPHFGNSRPLFYRSKLRKLMKEYNQEIKFNPYCVGSFYKRAGANYLLGHYQDAIQDYDQAIALDPYDPSTFNNRALAKRKLGLYQAAMEDFNHAIILNPNHRDAFFNRGSTQYDLGQYERAVEDFERALALNPNDEELFRSHRVANFMDKSSQHKLNFGSR